MSLLWKIICCCFKENPYQPIEGRNESGDDENQQTIRTIRRLLLDQTRNMSPRDNVVRYHLKGREEEFTEVKDYRLFCLTWNVNKKPPKEEELRKWLTCKKDNPDQDRDPEIYVIGFQELGLSMQACLSLDSKWEDTVRRSLPSGTRYVKKKQIRMWRIMILVYVSETIDQAIPSDLIDADSVTTGIMGIMGNKGGVGVRMTLHNTSLCFINTHLAAHLEKNERRNQLHQQIGITDVFRGYKEGKIKFHPTYKYKTESNDWHASKQRPRIPSWCDRILYKGEGIEQVDYSSHLVDCVSDHKPVTSLFKIKVNVVDENKAVNVLQNIEEKMDSFEKEMS
ncbi:type II inositol 1,4,5-trisphosphate 5-phosphatase-like isoform X1 [Crassostrea virginica]